MPATNEGGESSGSPFPALTAFLSFKNCVVLFTMLLVCSAVMTIILYVLQMQNNSSLFKAVCDIRMFVVKQNNSRVMSDLQVLTEARRLSDILSKWREKNTDLNNTFHDLQQKLNNEWRHFSGFIYFLSSKKGNFWEAKKSCENYGARLALIETSGYEDFLEKWVQERGAPHWIGLRYNISRRMWTWEDGSRSYDNFMFWNKAKKMPKPFKGNVCEEGSQNSCAVIAPYCPRDLQCWENAFCRERKNFICKYDYHRKFMTLVSDYWMIKEE